MTDSKYALEHQLNQLGSQTNRSKQTFTNTVAMTGIPGYADKATAEAALDVGELYYITTTGVVMIATA